MFEEAEKIMQKYNRSLRSAIEADKEASENYFQYSCFITLELQALQKDESRTDLTNPKHFPRKLELLRV